MHIMKHLKNISTEKITLVKANGLGAVLKVANSNK